MIEQGTLQRPVRRRPRVWKLALGVSACLVGSVFAAAEAAALSADRHTIALLKLDEMQGDVAKDASGNGCHARFEKAPRDAKWYKHGRYGGCIAFDGRNADENNDKRGDADGLSWRKGGTPDPEGSGFTAEMWVRHAHLRGKQYYLSRGGPDGRYVFCTKDGGKLYVAFKPAKASWVRVTTKHCVTVGVWHHVAFTYDKQALRIFCDGVEMAKTPMPGRIASGTPLTIIGRDTDLRPSQIRGFCGLIDEVRISSIARTSFPKGPHKTKDPMPAFLKKARMLISAVKGKADLAGVKVDVGGLEEKGQQITVSGVVYVDANKNKKKDAGEKPSAGVLVTNGDDVVRTSADGRYRFAFKINDGRHIAITEPSGYRASGPFYRRIALTEAKDYTYDFGLVEDPASRNPDFSFVVGADIQYGLAGNYSQLAADFAEIAGVSKQTGFATFAGDLTPRGHPENLMALKKAATEIWRKRFYPVFGGHDGNNATKVGNFMDIFGPYACSWDYGGGHFIGLVSELGYLKGERRARQFRWLMKDVALQPKNKPIWVVTHIPGSVRTYLAKIAASHNLQGVIRGHYHDNNNYEGPGGVPVICTAPYRPWDWGVFTRKCRTVHLKGDTITSTSRVIGQENRLIITSPAPGSTVAAGEIHVQANAYDTDDAVAAAACEITTRGRKATVKLQPHSDWSWWGKAKAQPGSGAIRVVVTGRSGKKWERTAKFRCATGPAPDPRPGKDWPTVLGWQNRTRALDKPLAPPLRLAWIGHTGGLCYYYSSPAVAGGKVVIGVTDGEVNGTRAGVACFDARTGERLWKTQTKFDVHSSVAVADGMVCALTGAGPIYGMKLDTGKIVWKDRVIPAKFGWTACYAPVTTAGGRFYALGAYAPVFAFNARTGKRIWRRSLGAWYRPTAGLGVFDGVGYASDNGLFGAIDLKTGKVLYEKKMERRYRGKSTPVKYGDLLYLAHAGRIRAVNAATGEQVWSVGFGNGKQPGLPVVKDGRLFATSGSKLYALDAKTGKTIWAKSTSSAALYKGNRWQTITESSSPAVAGKYVYVGTENGTFYCLDAATGKELWQYFVGVPIKSAPAISGNMIFFSAWDGNVYAFTAGQ